MQVKLKVLVGKKAGKELPVPCNEFIIGRSDECHLRPKSDSISRRHCQITINGETVSVRDLGSRNGTHVNGERIEQRQLFAGDKLRVGKLEFEVLVDSPADSGERKSREQSQEPESVAASPTPAPKTEHAGSGIGDSGSFFDESDVSDWLNEGDEIDRTRKLAEPDTKQFLLDQTDRVELEKAQEEAESGSTDTDVGSAQAKGKKPKPGKLPKVPTVKTDNSREAAADMLKRFFNRR